MRCRASCRARSSPYLNGGPREPEGPTDQPGDSLGTRDDDDDDDSGGTDDGKNIARKLFQKANRIY